MKCCIRKGTRTVTMLIFTFTSMLCILVIHLDSVVFAGEDIHCGLLPVIHRADSRFAPNQWETALLCNDASHWLGASLESARIHISISDVLLLQKLDVIPPCSFHIHYNDVIMSEMAFQSPASRLIQQFIQAQIRENIKTLRHWPLWREFTGDRWIPRTKGQQRGTCSHLMTSSWFYSLLLQAVDVGGSMFVHVFGAYFGIAMGAVMAKNGDVEEQDHKAASVYHADLFSMIGERCFHV